MFNKAANLFCLTAAICISAPVLTSCGDEEFEGHVTGAALITKTTDGETYRVLEVYEGDEVTLKIGAVDGQNSNIGIKIISGVAYSPEVHYLIDGKEVGMTNKYESYFSMPYTVKDLASGEHVLSVDIPQIYHNIVYNVNVLSTKFTVKERPDTSEAEE